ncbi:MAG: AAA family ATPase [Ktedonobacteraceae bacterium]|nr:AAA family ATPase [Chloroflexota bacterium]
MSNLILNSLEIRNFRAFEHLQIERLGRVNLIVGKNNVGKTSLLEAIQLYASRGAPLLIWEILGRREEGRLRYSDHRVNIEELLTALKYLFYGRREVMSYFDPIQVGSMNLSETALSLSVGMYTRQVDEEGKRQWRLLQPEEYDLADSPAPRLTVQIDGKVSISYQLDNTLSPRLLTSEIKEINSVFSVANGLTKRQISELWDNIALTNLEKDVLEALRIIAPGVEGINLVSDTPVSRDRIPIVKIRSINEPLPLRSLGDGMQRVLGIVLALVNARDGILLIDEFENGIHYSAQPDLWHLIFRVANHLNVQVFVTTHSWDCVEAFQQATQENTQNEGLLIRLENKKGKLVATTFDEERLAVITREQIEVR